MESSFSEGLTIEIVGGIIASIVVLILIFFKKKIFSHKFDKPAPNPIKPNGIIQKPHQNNKQNVNVNFNVGNNKNLDGIVDQKYVKEKVNPERRRMIIDSMKAKIKILFIDDDTKFNMVKILKSDGWKNTQSIEDLKGLDIAQARESDVFFVDINGVGKILKCEYQGLDLAQMLKEKYPEKKVVIYSANKDQHAFHPAWDICDKRLEKNALPNQFEKIVEDFSIELNSK